MSWNKSMLKRIKENAQELPSGKLIQLIMIMVDEINDNIEVIEEYTRAYSILRDVADKHDNYASIRELFRRATNMAEEYSDLRWMLGPKAIGKMHKDRNVKLPIASVLKISEDLKIKAEADRPD